MGRPGIFRTAAVAIGPTRRHFRAGIIATIQGNFWPTPVQSVPSYIEFMVWLTGEWSQCC
jgi:hypothetical protein